MTRCQNIPDVLVHARMRKRLTMLYRHTLRFMHGGRIGIVKIPELLHINSAGLFFLINHNIDFRYIVSHAHSLNRRHGRFSNHLVPQGRAEDKPVPWRDIARHFFFPKCAVGIHALADNFPKLML